MNFQENAKKKKKMEMVGFLLLKPTIKIGNIVLRLLVYPCSVQNNFAWVWIYPWLFQQILKNFTTLDHSILMHMQRKVFLQP